MFKPMITIKIITVSLFCSSVLLGMKRVNETNENKVTVFNNNTTTSQPKLSTCDKLNKLYAASLPNLKIVDALYTPSNQKFIQLASVDEKICALRDLYPKRKKDIDTIQERRKALLLSLPEKEALLRLENEEKQIPIDLKKNKNIVQNELRQAYNIDRTSQKWLTHMFRTQAKARFNVQSMRQPWNNTTWDINTPYKFALSLLEHMQQNGLDPSAFNVEVAPDKWRESIVAAFKPARPILASGNTTVSFEEFIKNPKQEIWYYEKNKPALIRFNPLIAEYNDDSIDFIVGHELQHALNSDLDWDNGTMDAVACCANVGEIELHPAFVKLVLAQENVADTNGFLQDHTKVHADVNFESLYPESYNVFAMIKTNADVRAEIASRK